MPKIPTAPPPAPGQYPTINPDQAGASFNTVAQAADQGSRLAMYGFDVARTVQAAEDHVVTQTLQNQIRTEVEKLSEGHAQDVDYLTISQRAQDEAEEMKKRYQDALATNPRVSRAIGPFLDSYLEDYRRVIETKRLGLMKEDNHLQLIASRADSLRKMATAATPEEKEMYRNEYQLQLLSAQNVHLITGEEGFAFMQDLDLDAERAEIAEAVKSADTRAIVHMLDKLKTPDSFPALRGAAPEFLANAQGALDDNLAKLNDRLQSQADEATVNESVASLEDAWGENYDAARNDLYSRAFQIKHNLTDANGNPDIKRVGAVASWLNAREARAKNSADKAIEAYDAKVVNLFLKRDYVGARQMLLNPDKPTDPKRWEALSNAIDQKTKRSDDDISAREQAAEYLRISQMIDSGQPPDVIRTEIIGSEHLKTAIQQRFLDRMETHMEAEGKYAQTAAHQLLRQQIVVNSEFDDIDPNIRAMEQLQASNAEQDFDDWLKKENQARAARNQPLISAAEAHEHALEMLPRYELTIDQRTGSVTQEVSKWNQPTEGESRLISVTAPDGSIHYFPNQEAANRFKQLAGIK